MPLPNADRQTTNAPFPLGRHARRSAQILRVTGGATAAAPQVFVSPPCEFRPGRPGTEAALSARGDRGADGVGRPHPTVRQATSARAPRQAQHLLFLRELGLSCPPAVGQTQALLSRQGPTPKAATRRLCGVSWPLRGQTHLFAELSPHPSRGRGRRARTCPGPTSTGHRGAPPGRCHCHGCERAGRAAAGCRRAGG